MASDKQIAANRANATHSTGPQSPAGKAASAQNATSHGLFAATVAVHYWESKTEFDALRRSFLNRFRPIDDVESALVDRLVDSTWRRRRAVAMETTLLDLEIEHMNDELEQTYAETEDGLLRVTLAFLKRHEDGAIDAIQRHIAAAERSYSRATRELRLLQGDRFNQIPAETGEKAPKTIEIAERSQFRPQPPAEPSAPAAKKPEIPENQDPESDLAA